MWKCKYMETSAKEGTNVNELFEELLKLETSRTLSLQPIEEAEKKKGVKKMKEKCNLM
jgi:GTPase SAR1 family protein